MHDEVKALTIGKSFCPLTRKEQAFPRIVTMTKKLIILESPNKIKAYQSFLNADYKVIASSGHIKDLPKKKLGIDIEHGFRPQYVTIASKTKEIAEIKKCALEADEIYLATDPDREGEAIAVHIAEVIKSVKKNPKILRILPQEISKKAILHELANPTSIDQNKYDSQQARRVLDRLVGYQISPILWDKVRRGLSAGRVQSVAVRLIVDREHAIRDYKKLAYWKIQANLNTPSHAHFRATLVRDGKQTIHSDQTNVEKYYPKGVITDEQTADQFVSRSQAAPFIVANVEKKRRENRAAPPFATADLLRCASSQLGFSSKTTSSIAQKLFESVETADGPVGLITYIRTDSVRVSDEAIDACRAFISEKYGSDYLPKQPIHHEAAETTKKKNTVKIQDAHEAIRPTDVRRTPESVKPFLSRDQFKLYDLIWRRFVASQMTPAVSDVTTIQIANGDLLYSVSGSVPKFPGYKRALLNEDKDDFSSDENEGRLPELNTGDVLGLDKLDKLQQFTQPPKRYTEATFIKELKDRGIGRPSTITTTVVNIQQKGYVEKIKDTFKPTELGELVTDLLIKSFPDILEIEYTKDMEDKLEIIAAGEQSWQQTLSDFYGPFEKALENANESMRNVKREAEETNITCEKCGAPMVIKWGKNGHFLACSNYPDCKNTKEFKRADDGTITPQEKVIQYAGTCPDCGKPLVIRNGKFGKFLACSGYPECKHTEAIALNVSCPREGCNGKIVQKRTKRGKIFYGCNRYPNCDFSTWNEPTNETCPDCGKARLEIIKRAKNSVLLCPSCAYSRPLDQEQDHDHDA